MGSSCGVVREAHSDLPALQGSELNRRFHRARGSGRRCDVVFVVGQVGEEDCDVHVGSCCDELGFEGLKDVSLAQRTMDVPTQPPAKQGRMTKQI